MTDLVVLGASMAGLWTAVAAVRAGARVVLLDRDQAPLGSSLRPGVPQGAQPHVILHRGLRAGEELLPGLLEDLRAVGGVSVDTGLLPWLGEYGWLPDQPSYRMVSLTRPLFEHVVRQRVLALPDVRVRWGARVVGLAPCNSGWRVRVEDGSDVTGSLIVDATGRTSRLPTWLAELGVSTPEPLTVDARLGYATQLIEGGPHAHDLPGAVIQATPQSPVSGIALPVEGRRWLVTAMGFGVHRPPRNPDEFAAFLARLPDPALSAILRSGHAVGEVAVHRQTSNRRHRYAREPSWPDGLIAVGDALCCFDPIYGQGITVSACQALHLRKALAQGPGAPDSRRVLRSFDQIVDFPWAVAIGQDLAMPSSSGERTPAQAAVSAWASQVARRAVQGDRRAHQVLMKTYHMETSPTALLHPALIGSVAFGRLRRAKPPAPRPAVLNELTA
jgi:2-polyprenyl-6-methoxyphenol hydroxylase-like FAD-dependent oxidoreductase